MDQPRTALLSPNGISLLFAVFVIMYFQNLTSLVLTADDDHAIFGIDSSVFIGQGRWRPYLTARYILPSPAIPYLPYAVFGLLASVAFALLAGLLGHRTASWPVLTAFALFITVPQWGFITGFTILLLPLGLGLVCASGCAALFRPVASKMLPMRMVTLAAAAGILLALIASFYQPLVLAAMLMSSGVILWGYVSQQTTAKQALILHAVLLVSGLLSLAINHAVLRIFTDVLGFGAINFYPDGMFHPSEAIQNWRKSLNAAISTYWGVVWGAWGFYGTGMFAFGLATMAATFASAVLAFSFGWSRGIVFTLWACLAWVSVLVPHFAAAGAPTTYRILMHLPALVAVVSLIALNTRIQPSRAVLLLVFVAAIFQGAVLLNRAATSAQLVGTLDAYMAGALFERIATVGSPGADGLFAVQAYGSSPGRPVYPLHGNTYMTTSWFAFGRAEDLRSSVRMSQYMRALGYPVTFARVPKGVKAFSDQWPTMPSWPAEGAVISHEGFVLIKLSE